MSSINTEFIKNNPKKAITTLMIPIIIGSIFETLNSIVDSIWVSGLGANALTAVGLISPLFIGMVGIGLGLSIGTNSTISRLLGKGDHDEANNVAIHSLILSVVLSVIATVVIIVFLKEIIIALGAGVVLKEATDYSFYLFIGTCTILIPQILSGVFLAEGNADKATYPLILISILNMALNPIFIYVLKFNIAGSAIATIVAHIIGLIVILNWLFLDKKTSFTFNKAKYKRKLSIYKEILIIGIPAGLEEIALAILCVVLNLLILQVAGVDTIAAFSVAWRVVQIGIIPCIGVGSASVTVAGITYGAKNFKNLLTTVRYGTTVGFIFSLAIFIVLNLFSNQIALIFAYSDNSAYLAPLISHIIRLISFFILAEPFGDVSTYVLQGMGKGITSFILIVSREIVFIILAVYTLGIILNFGATGIFVGIDVGMAIGSAIAYLYAEYTIHKLKKK